MSANVSDFFQKLGGASALVNTPKVTAARSPGGTSLTVDNCNWDTTTGKRFATFQVDTSGNVVDGTEIIWKGIVTGSTSIGSLARVAGATDTGNAIGDYVMLLPASDWANQLVSGLLVQHNQDGTHGAITSTGATLTTPKVITSINDSNGNEVVKVSATSSAVNEVTITNAATGNAPQISATGDDTNIDLKLAPKGTGRVVLNGAGTSLTAAVATAETTTSTSFTDLATSGPAVTATIGLSGMALVAINATMGINSSTNTVRVAYAISGASTVAASDAQGIRLTPLVSGGTAGFGGVFLATGLTPGSNTFTMKYRVTGSTGTYELRTITVVPL